jgi:hypothetical protein
VGKIYPAFSANKRTRREAAEPLGRLSRPIMMEGGLVLIHTAETADTLVNREGTRSTSTGKRERGRQWRRAIEQGLFFFTLECRVSGKLMVIRRAASNLTGTHVLVLLP